MRSAVRATAAAGQPLLSAGVPLTLAPGRLHSAVAAMPLARRAGGLAAGRWPKDGQRVTVASIAASPLAPSPPAARAHANPAGPPGHCCSGIPPVVRCDEPAQPTMSAPDDDDETSQPWHPDAAAAIATKERVEASGVGVGGVSAQTVVTPGSREPTAAPWWNARK